MTTVLSPAAKQQFFDNNGRPLIGGQLFVYETGTSTKATTYTSSSGLVPNSNPVILDYRGECNLWIDPNVRLKYVLAPSNDTDPPSNPIWSVDDIVSSQLITLYGGIDTGIASAYVLNFTANFSAYQDGIVIYWIPSNTNTGASTINVNGIGPVAITNQDGSALTPGQLQANQIAVILYLGFGFVLISSGTVPFSGTFTGMLTGGAGAAVTVSYWVNNKQCTLRASAANIASSTTAMTMTGLPGVVTPQSGASVIPCLLRDNGAVAGGWAQVNSGTGTITFGIGINNNQSGFTGSGNKGLGSGWSITYALG